MVRLNFKAVMKVKRTGKCLWARWPPAGCPPCDRVRPRAGGSGPRDHGGKLTLEFANLPGYLLALAAAFTWSSYSLLTKRVRPFPTGAVGGFCLASGVLSLGLFALDVTAFGAPVPTLTPLLSTLNLVLWGGKRLSGVSMGAMALIVLGAVVGSLDLFRRQAAKSQALSI